MPALLTTASRRPNAETAVDDRLPALGRVDGLVVRDRATARGFDLGDDGIGNRRVGAVARHRPADVVDDHGRASLRQIERVQAAEAAAGSGHHRDLVGEGNGPVGGSRKICHRTVKVQPHRR